MSHRSSQVRRAVPPIAAIVLLAAFYLLSREPALSHPETDELAARFAFDKIPLPELDGYTRKSVRDVHPSLKHISAWISTLGAAVALADLDGDGLPNDLCYVDPRIDQVIVAPVPGMKEGRYAPFVLQPGPLPYDPSTMAPMGCLVGDFNEDGLPDILVYYWGRTPVLFLQKPVNASGSRKLNSSDFIPVELITSTVTVSFLVPRRPLRGLTAAAETPWSCGARHRCATPRYAAARG